jgi:hypothetical protein
MGIFSNVGKSVLGTIAKKAVGKVIGWGASTIFGMDKDKVAENVYDTLEAVGVASRDAGLFDEKSGIMSKSMPSLDFTGGISYAKQKMAKGPPSSKVIGAEKMDKEWELRLMSDYFVQTRYTPKASDIASQVTKVPIMKV